MVNIKSIKRKLIKTGLIIVFSTFFLNINSQNKPFSGFVEDLMTGEKLVGATIIEMNSKKNVVSNNYGFFSINSNNNYSVYLISSFGYMPKTVSILTSMKMPLIIRLTPNNLELEGVIASGSETDVTKNSSLLKLNVKETKTLPSLFGETDIFKVAQLMPGIAGGSEGNSNVFIRGGNADENMILLDGVPLISTNHLYGFFSVFNPDAIRDFKIYKGSFPSMYGGSLSAVTEIFMKDGNVNNYHGIFDIGLLSSKFTLEGPISEGNSSFIISGRRSYTNLALKPFGNFIKNIQANGFYFYDLNGKFSYKITDKSRISISQYVSRDNSLTNENANYFNISSSYKEQLTWGNYLSVLRWNYVISDNMFLNVIASYTAYRFQNSIGNDYSYKSVFPSSSSLNSNQSYSIQTTSQVDDYRLKTELTNYINVSNQLNYGFCLSSQQFNPQTENRKYQQSKGQITIDTLINNSSYKIINGFLYAEEVFHLNPKTDITAGAHFSYYNSGGTIYTSPEPRFNMLFRPNESLTLNGSFSKMEQYSHILSFSKLSNKSDLFVNSTDTIKPSEAWQADVGTNYTYSNFIFGADLYYKTMKQLIDYKESASYSINQSDLQEEIEVGRGASYGLELFIQKNKGKLNGFISYTLSQSERVFPGINSGKSFAFNYDKAHQLNINLNYNITDNLLVTALWVFNSGIPFSMGSVAYPSIDNFQLYAGGPNYTDVVVFNKNSSRLPAYHRLDLGFSYTHHARFGKGTISAGCYNAYNRKNAYRYIVEERSGLHYFVKTEQYLFPILPYVSYKIEF